MTGSTNQFIHFEPTNTLSKMLIIHRKSIMLMHRPQTPQPGFGSITLLRKVTPPPPPNFKILDLHLTRGNPLPPVFGDSSVLEMSSISQVNPSWDNYFL